MKKVIMSLLIVILIIIAVPAAFLYVLNNGNPYTTYIANKYVPAYIEAKGYTENEIEEMHFVEPKHMINSDFYQGHYMVVFADELDVTYYYGITKKEKKVSQFCEKDCAYSL